MRVVCVAFGTRGDVQPVVALGKALYERGHELTVLASRHFASWIEKHGLRAAPSNLDIQQIMQSEGGHQWVERGNHPLQQLRAMRKLFDATGMQMAADALSVCQGADLLLGGFVSDPILIAIAETLGVKHLSLRLQPAMIPTRNGAAMLNAPLPNRISSLNYWVGKRLYQPVMWMMAGAVANQFRRQTLGLHPLSRAEFVDALQRLAIIHGYSRHVVPHPQDWPAHLHTTGYWFLNEGQYWCPPQHLLDFIGAGEAPVAIGFGSMTGRNPGELTRWIIEALARCGQRGLLLSGWSGLGGVELPSTILRCTEIPHDWLFAHVAAVVHHGGAGTTAATLRAGIPTVIVPHMADQPFWGQRVAALGVGPKPIPRNRLTSERLAAALQQATSDSAMRCRTQQLAEKICREDGVALAVRLIEASV